MKEALQATATRRLCRPWPAAVPVVQPKRSATRRLTSLATHPSPTQLQADKVEFVRSKVAEWQQSLRYEPKHQQQ